jgi:non-heme chloroperoxidase
MLKTDTNPEGLPIEVFDEIRERTLTDNSQYWLDLAEVFYSANHGRDVSYGTKLDFWRQSMMVNLSAAYDCIRAFSETDLTEDLKKITIPMLLNHGDDDQIVPVDDASTKAVKLVPNGTLKIYPGAPHGIMATTGSISIRTCSTGSRIDAV